MAHATAPMIALARANFGGVSMFISTGIISRPWRSFFSSRCLCASVATLTAHQDRTTKERIALPSFRGRESPARLQALACLMLKLLHLEKRLSPPRGVANQFCSRKSHEPLEDDGTKPRLF